MDPTEHIHEHLQHTVAHGDEHEEHNDHGEHGHGGHLRWITAAALTAAILAAFAAVSGALSNSYLLESTHRRIDANDQWSYYQSKSIKASIIDVRMYMATLAHVAPPKKDSGKKAEYEEQLPAIQKTADALVKISNQLVDIHETYETAETMFHISIAIVAIAVVAKRRSFWYVSMVMGVVGIIFFGRAYSHRVDAEPAEPTAAKAPATLPEGGDHKAVPATHAATAPAAEAQ